MKNGREEATVRKVGRVWAGGRRGKLETSSFEKIARALEQRLLFEFGEVYSVFHVI